MEVFLSTLVASIPELPAWFLIANGFYISFRVLKFPDLTVDASFTTGTVGAACGAIYFHSAGLGFLLSILLGSIAGFLTALLFISNPKPAYKLLSGVFVIFSFYSINYRVLDYKVEAGFYRYPTLFQSLAHQEITYNFPFRLMLGILLSILIFFFFVWLFKTSYGIIFRSIGSRPLFNDSINKKIYITGLILANVTVAIGGWYYASINFYTSINIFGTIIHALAIAIIGEIIIDNIPLFRDRRTSPYAIMLAPILGAFLYNFVKAFVAFMMTNSDSNNVNQQDHNTFVALFLITIILITRFFVLKRLSIHSLSNDLEEF